MTTTPTLWKPPYRLAPGLTVDQQNGTTSVTLADGRILTVWTDFGANVGFARSPDVIAQFSDALGNLLGPPINLTDMSGSYSGGTQDSPELVALSNGGAIVVFNDRGGTHDQVKFLRLDPSGVEISRGTIATGGNDYELIDVDVLPDGDILVGFKRPEDGGFFPGGGEKQFARIIDGSTFSLGPVLNLGQSINEIFVGLDDYSEVTDVAALKNGNFVMIYRTTGPYDIDLAGRIFDQSGQLVRTFIVNLDMDAVNPKVAALANGNFVVGWDREDLGNSDCRVRVYNANGDAVSSVITLAAGADVQHVDDIIGLPDGGFYAVHYNANRGMIFGQRFSASGSVIGISNEFITDGDGRLSLTSDGRIVISYTSNGDPMQTIVDPRNTLISGSEAGEVLTAQTTASTILAGGGEDLIYGSAGGDWLAGEDGQDVIRGGAGNDLINGGAGYDFVYGEDGNDNIYITAGHQFDYVDGGAGSDTLSIGNAVAGASVNLQTLQYNLRVHFPAIYSVLGIENVNGTAQDDIIAGDGNANRLSGGGGADVVNAGGGDDLVYGDLGNDTLRDGTGTDYMHGGADDDTFYLDADGVSDTVAGDTGTADVIDLTYATAATTVSFGATAFAGTASGGGQGATTFTGIERIYGSTFVDTVTGGASGEYIFTRDGGDSVYSGGGNDIIYADAGNDYVNAGANDDYIESGSGNDGLTGGTGLDTFDFNLGSGTDTVYDFSNDQDTLRIDPGYGFANAAAVVAATTAVGNNALITLGGGNTITLVNYLASNTINSLLDDISIV